MEGVVWFLVIIGIVLILVKIGDSIIECFEFFGVFGEFIMGMIFGNFVYFGYVVFDYLFIVSGMGYEFVLN